MSDEQLLAELVRERESGSPGPPVEPAEVKAGRLLRLELAMRRARNKINDGRSV